MKKPIYTKTLKLIAGILCASVALVSAVYADKDPSVTYSTPLLPNVMDYQVDGDVIVDVNVAAVNALEITLSSSRIYLDLVPGMVESDFKSDTLNILVGTTNSTGYTLTMATSYNNESTTSLTRTAAINNEIPTIDTIETSVTPDTFSSTSDTTTVNKWGYLLSTTNLEIDKTKYSPIETTLQLNSNTTPVSNDPTVLTLGAKVDNTLPAGNYRATLKFMAVTNPTSKSINDLVYMQDFKNLTASEVEEVKESMGEEVTYILKDSRDEQEYNIALMKDGVVWMMSNLKINNGVQMYKENTNIANEPSNPFVLPSPISSSCPNNTYTSPVYCVQTGSDSYGNIYGNRYNFCAASGGSYCYDIGNGVGNAIYDICPAGWRLPVGASGQNEYENLLNAYGYNSATYFTEWQSVLKLPTFKDKTLAVYQTSTYSNAKSMVTLYYYGTSWIQANAADQWRLDLNYVRCVLKNAE